MPADWITPLLIGLDTLLALAASAITVARLRQKSPHPRLPGLQYLLLWAVTVLSAALLAYRAWRQPGWNPLQSHADGLVTLAALLGLTAAYLQTGKRLPGLAGFLAPLLALILAWALCASLWTYQPPWRMDSIWLVVHLVAVYGGTLFIIIAAAAGAMFLYVDRKLRRRQALSAVRPLASLEALDRAMVKTATLGFALLTLGLITGAVRLLAGPTLQEEGWWYAPKVALAVLAWLAFALLMNIRFSSRFSGPRAAWLCLVGLVLLLATFGAVTALERHGAAARPDPVSLWVPAEGLR